MIKEWENAKEYLEFAWRLSKTTKILSLQPSFEFDMEALM